MAVGGRETRPPAERSLVMRSLLKSPRAWLVVVLTGGVLAAVLVTMLWPRVQGGGPEDDGYSSPLGVGEEDELLGGRLLDVTDPDPSSPGAKQTSTPATIDGRPGRLSRGWYANGKPAYEEGWLNGGHRGVRQGRFARWYANGRLAEEGSYDRFLLHGMYRTWFRSGRQSTQATYGRGLREGEFTAWHRNGVKQCEAHFAADRLDGPWREWDARGMLVRSAEYQQGRLLSAVPGRRREPFAFPGPLGARDFALVLGQGSGWHGYHTLRVSAAGRCDFTYFVSSSRVSTGGAGDHGIAAGQVYTDQVWRRAEFQLSDPEQLRLREALVAADVFGLQDEYINRRVADGTQWVVWLRAGG
jgi:hypothetical protein